MADKKISALSSATTPLAGTEVLPIVQSGATVKVPVNDLTVQNIRSNATTGIMQVTGPAAGQTRVVTVPDANATMARTDAGQEFTGNQTVNGTLWVKDTNNLQFGYNALRATINGSDAFTFTPRSGYGFQFNGEATFYKVEPQTDNTYSLGSAGRRWSEVFAATAIINTSDARDKTEVRSLNDAELAASKSLAKEIGAFKFLSAVLLKGDAAREHIGMTVQRAIEIMQSHGLDAFNYGFICFDKWDDQYVDVEVPEEYVDEEGQTQTRPVKTGEKRLVLAAGEKYGFRTDQLLMFIARGFEARLAALESK